MITIKKLKTLKPGTLRRKTAVLLQSFEIELFEHRLIDKRYLDQFLELTTSAFEGEDHVARRAEALRIIVSGCDEARLIRELNGLRHEILKALGSEPADWDLSISRDPVSRMPVDGLEKANRAGIEVYLDDLRSPFNIGSIFRSSEAFGVSRILLSPDCPSPSHARCLRSSMGCTELVDWSVVSRDAAFEGKTVFALELGGDKIENFSFPKNGIAVIGSEELGISPEARVAAKNSGGLVSIPIFGRKGSINVSVAFGIMMQRWSEMVFKSV